ncbi:MAG: hypothetical protein SOT34_04490 [Candidatus Borkfalkiaceae bacterium]|nr:hypothetical protein [Christensenellaceae bacterium]
MDDRCVIFYDSGIGGRYAFHKAKERFPSENFLYFSDAKNMPYGNRSEGELASIFNKNLEILSSFCPKAVVFACNTISVTFPYAEIRGGVKIFRVFPVLPQGKRTLLLATRATAESGYVRNAIKDRKDVVVLPLGRLARDIEEGRGETSEDWKRIDGAGKDFETVSLGCTHYRILEKKFREKFPGAEIADGTDETMERLFGFLEKEPHSARGV